jgi:PKD repeat protein
MKISFPLFLLLILSLSVSNLILVHANPSLNITVKTDKQQYAPADIVQVSGNLTLDGIPTIDGLVGLEIQNSRGPVVVRTLPAVHPPSETPYILTEYVVPCYTNGTPKFSFRRNTIAYFKISVVNLDHFHPYPVFLIVNVYDSTNTPLGSAEFHEPLLPDSSSLVIISFLIPSDAALGTATVYGNAFSNWPSLGGTPYVREANNTFTITSDGSEAEQLTQNQFTTLQSNGTVNYNTTFRLAAMATPDKYFVYVTSSYQGETASNSTTFILGHGPDRVVGDLGGGVPPRFFQFDGIVNSRDLNLLLQCFKGTAPPEYMYLGDLGSRVNGKNEFFIYDGVVSATDLNLFMQCYKGLGPTGPTAVFTWSPLNPISNQPVTFNASQSYDDHYGNITSYSWLFGDGNATTVTNPIIGHTFTSSGNYTVSLTVTDNNLLTNSTSSIIGISS